MSTPSPLPGPPKFIIPRSFCSTENNKTGSWRYLKPAYREKTSPCSMACPAGEDIARIEMLIAEEAYKEAWETLLLENPFPAICGRVCFHPCEKACNRIPFDEAVSIRILERFLGDMAARYALVPTFYPLPAKNERVAVIGAGPAGLAAAYFLSLLGYGCDVFEKEDEPGGILRWGIPDYRLPPVVLKQEIEQMRRTGFHIFCNQEITDRFEGQQADAYQAFFIGCGYGRPNVHEIPGVNLPGVIEGLAFLKRVKQHAPISVNGRNAIIGGGNTAVDVARSIIRLGGKAEIFYRRRKEDMPAFEEEMTAALAEGVILHELAAPLTIETQDGRLGVTFQKMAATATPEGHQASITPIANQQRVETVDALFIATGSKAEPHWRIQSSEKDRLLNLSHTEMCLTSSQSLKVFGGDLTTPVKSVTHAVASGKEAAMAIDTYFRAGFDAIENRLKTAQIGNDGPLSMALYLNKVRARRSPHIVRFEEINIDYFEIKKRLSPPRLLLEERITSFQEIELKISAGLATKESGRCFHCGLCNQCDNCRLYCPDVAILLDQSGQNRRVNYDYCKGCGVCVAECPRNAMILEEEGP